MLTLNGTLSGLPFLWKFKCQPTETHVAPTECRVGSALAIRADQNRKSTNIFTTFNGYQPMSNQKSNLKLVFLEFLL